MCPSSRKNQKLSKTVEKIWKNHKKFLKINNFIKNIFEGSKGVKGVFVPQIAPNSPKNGKLSETVEKISKNLKKFLKINNFIKKYFWGVKRGKRGKMDQNSPKIHGIRHNSCLLDRMSPKRGSNVSYSKSITLRC